MKTLKTKKEKIETKNTKGAGKERVNLEKRKSIKETIIKIAFAGAALVGLSGVVNAAVNFRSNGQDYTLSSTPVNELKYISVTAQGKGNLNLSDATNWNLDKVLITSIKCVTTSTNYELTLYSKNDFTTGEYKILIGGNAPENILLNYPYIDADSSKQVHLKYNDVAGTATAAIEIRGIRLT